ncbi:hypothetical protein Nepgr_029407 [Nepenthes gracilis]|uniref:Uncharacterized protein n=1 Tax=Nepenthes gracilis TaxID=150966 RepID=A0AAD3TE00_NEPGR|nr:hypothetical protein Nepgr_029407 [Nepenthes gracilis]
MAKLRLVWGRISCRTSSSPVEEKRVGHTNVTSGEDEPLISAFKCRIRQEEENAVKNLEIPCALYLKSEG